MVRCKYEKGGDARIEFEGTGAQLVEEVTCLFAALVRELGRNVSPHAAERVLDIITAASIESKVKAYGNKC